MFNKFFLEKIELFLRKYFILIFVFLIGSFSIILPFIISNNLEGFDHSGQYASAYYIKNFFWPWPNGWNSMFLSGFPQGIFYPSFFHWIIALFSFIIPLDLSYKIVLSFAILLFPIIVFFLAFKLFKNYFKASAVLVIISILYYFNVGLNDNLYSDVYYGMSSHLFSLTIFFLYLYTLYILIKDDKKWYLSAIVLAISIMTHVITASVSILFSFILLILSWKNNKLKKSLLKHHFGAFFISLFWILPFLMNIKYISGGDMTSSETLLLIILMPFILLLSLITLKIKNEYSLLLKTICIFNVFIIVVYILSKLFLINDFPIHFGRLLIYPFLLSSFLLIYYLNNKLIKWRNFNLFLMFCFSFYFFYLNLIPVGPFSIKILDKVEEFWQGGRIIVTGDSIKLDNRFHSTRTKLAVDHQIPIAGGLFTESSSNGWFMMSLLKSWDSGQNSNFIWAYNDLENVIDLNWGSKIFGINYEYRIQDKSPTIEENDFKDQKQKSIDISNNKNLDFKISRIRLLDDEKVISMLSGGNSPFYYQTLYKINDTGIAEVLDIKPINISENWDYNLRKWWSTDWLKVENSEVYKKPILIYNKNIDDWVLPKNNKVIPFIENKKMDSFMIDASDFKSNVPIYIKVEYFPYWKAYDESGQKLEIYKASPNFMLVYGNGKITFKYTEDNYYYFGFIISGLTLLFFIFSFIYKRYILKNFF